MYSHALPAESSLRVIAGRYDVLAHIGSGGMGIVHQVRDRQTDRLLAIKQPWSGNAAGSLPYVDARASISRESLALARLDHPHIVHLLDTGTDELGEPFLVLELLEKPRTIVNWPPTASREERLRALVQMFEALAHVHSAQLVHGDVTPSNVLLCDHPVRATFTPRSGARVCLIDFGLVVGTEEYATLQSLDSDGPPSLVGCALYLAPELIEGAPMSISSDLYAAGMITAEVLTGTNPRSRTGPRTTLAALRDLPKTWIDEAAESFGRESRTTDLLRRLLARDPDERCSSADMAISELEAIGRET
jgi:serine/threonine-protein kinase